MPSENGWNPSRPKERQIMKQLILVIGLVAALLTACKTGSDLVLPQGTAMSDYGISYGQTG